MAKHEIIIHENTGATKEVAPYLGSYVSKETVHEYTFATALAEKCGLPAIQVMAILDGVFAEIEKMEKESLVRVHLDGFTVCGVIKGSFPSADAAFDPARNALELALRLDDDVKLDLVDVVPTIVTDLTVTKLRVDNVMDLETPKPYNLVHGAAVFRVAGFNMVLDDEGAEAYLQNALGQTFPLTVDEVVSKQLFKAHVAGLTVSGDYKLVVKSRAGDAQGPLQTSFRRVKYLYVAPPLPAIDHVRQSGRADDSVYADANAPFAVVGSHLTLLEGDKVIAEVMSGEELADSFEITDLVTQTSDAELACSGLDLSRAADPAAWVAHSGRIVIKRGDTRIEHFILLVPEE